MEKLTPMMRQYHQIKMEHPGLLLFFRMGDFYEMFYEDAVIGSRELEITLTSRNKDRDGNPIPMCGFPHHAISGYLNKLLKKGLKVAICDQVEDPKLAKGIVRREVTRILTPGTATEEGVLDSKEHNFIASLFLTDDSAAGAFLDLSTGEFWVAEFSGDLASERLDQEFLHFRPREILFPEAKAKSVEDKLNNTFSEFDTVLTPQGDWIFNIDYARRILFNQFDVSSLDGFGLAGDSRAVCAAGALLTYIKETQKSDLNHISTFKVIEHSSFLRMDNSTVRNLELIEGVDGNKKWTLFSTLDLTKTGMGARQLRQWMLRPSMSIEEINLRLDAVSELKDSVIGMNRLGKILSSVYDVERLLSRVTMATANPRDLVALRESLRLLPELDRELDVFKCDLLSPEIDHLSDVVELLDRSINDEPPVQITDGRIIKQGYHAELDEIRTISTSGKETIAGIEAQEKQSTGIPSLKVKYNKVFGYFIDVTKTHLDLVPEHYIRKQTLVSSERYITPELKEYEEKVLGAEEKIVVMERDLFIEVRSLVAQEALRIQRIARLLALLDVLLSFADAANRRGYTRPELNSSLKTEIRAGRHPVLELQSEKPFVPNDWHCDADEAQMIILTGPNMGGKSTYLRQNALIVLMAQMGSFVPADEARIGLTDRIYTRVGASDNLSRGRSTFMVEMIETARILNTATRRSLVLLDEVGRGTATFDGLSIAWSVAEYLITEESRKARTLFATHYLELTKLEKLYESVRNFCVTIRESGNDIIFFHRVMPGTADKSYGIEVARLAGVPVPVIERARDILTRLERKQLDMTGRKRSSTLDKTVLEDMQKGLF